jgi:hypothetical protein
MRSIFTAPNLVVADSILPKSANIFEDRKNMIVISLD